MGRRNPFLPWTGLDPWSVEADEDRVLLGWMDGQLRLPERARAAIEMLAGARAPIAVDELPGLEPGEQLLLARRLLDERAVALVAPSA